MTPMPEEEYVATTVNEYLTLMCFFPRGNNDWLIHNCIVSLNNTVKVHNEILNKQFMYMLLQMPAKGSKGLVIAAATLSLYRLLTKHLIQIST